MKQQIIFITTAQERREHFCTYIRNEKKLKISNNGDNRSQR